MSLIVERIKTGVSCNARSCHGASSQQCEETMRIILRSRPFNRPCASRQSAARSLIARTVHFRRTETTLTALVVLAMGAVTPFPLPKQVCAGQPALPHDFVAVGF